MSSKRAISNKPSLTVARNCPIFLITLFCTCSSVLAYSDLKLSSLDNAHGVKILGAAADDETGLSVSSAGDFNHDGVNDVIISAPFADPLGKDSAGTVYVIFGHNTQTVATSFPNIDLQSMVSGPTTGFRIFGSNPAFVAGTSVGGGGDVNGDGIDDIILSMHTASPSNRPGAGAAVVLFGHPSTYAFVDIDLTSGSGNLPTTLTNGFRILGAYAGNSLGKGVAIVPDINNDGLSDILIGAPFADAGSTPNAGVVTVIFGRQYPIYNFTGNIDLMYASYSDKFGFVILGASNGYNIGKVLSGAGDMNGDGINDYMIGVPDAEFGKGIVYVVYGRGTAGYVNSMDLADFDHLSGFMVNGANNSDSCGFSVAGGGDVDGDGFDDIVVGGNQADISFADAGSVYVIFGVRNSAVPVSVYNLNTFQSAPGIGFRIDGAGSSSRTGSSVSMVDTNNDGVDDVVIGAPYYTNANSEIGQVYVVLGRDVASGQAPFTAIDLQTLTTTNQGYKITGAGAGDHTGNSISNVGDVNGDGIDDIVIGAAGASASSRSSSGMSYIVYGQAYRPTSQPSSQPSTQPSSQPSRVPSRQPSSQPSSRPSRQPSGRPSAQPSAQPVGRPSSQPTSQPSSQPSAQPAGRPSAQPSAQPNARPSGQPTRQPTRQPTGQPSRQPSRQPTGQPSSRPSAHPTVVPPPTTEWVTALDTTVTVAGTTAVNGYVWACGSQNRSTSAQCSVVQAQGGAFVTKYTFPWDSVTSMLVISDSTNAVIGGRRTNSQTGVVTSTAANCLFGTEHITCAAMDFQGVKFVGGAYVPFTDQLMYISTYTGQPSVTILDSAISTSVAYTYTVSAMQSTTLYTVHSVSNFIGSFVGAVSVNSASVNFIVSGWVRADTGAMNLMYLTPITGNVVTKGSEGLITCMTVESTGPDTFMAGGLRLTDTAGTNAYLVRSNALYKTVLYAVRYRQTSSSRRRLATTSTTIKTIARGIVLAGDYVYLILDNTRSSSTSNVTMLSLIKSDASSGVIVSQAHVSAPSSQSLKCTDITTTTIGTDTNLYIACGVVSATTTQYIVLSSDTLLTFAKMPKNFVRTVDNQFYTQNVGFYGTNLPASIQNTYIPTTNTAFNSTGALPAAPTYSPTPGPTVSTMLPTSQPSSVPSAQPSSTPTVAPSVSARPTSQPSTASPTNTPKPSAVPVAKPSAKPSVTPSLRPSAMPTPQPSAVPTAIPTARPTAQPSTRPTPVPSIQPSASPKPTTSSPTTRPTVSPSTAAPSVTPVPTAVPTEAPTAVPTTQPTTNNQPAVTPVYVYGVAGAGGALLLALGAFLFVRYRRDHIERKTQRERFAKIVPGFGDDAPVIPVVMGIQGMDSPLNEPKSTKNVFGRSNSSRSANTSAFSSPRHSLVAGGAVDSPKVVANRKRLTSMDSQYSYNISEMSSDDEM